MLDISDKSNNIRKTVYVKKNAINNIKTQYKEMSLKSLAFSAELIKVSKFIF